MAHWPELVERLTGVGVPQLREAVRLFCEADSGMVLTARGPEQQSKGTDTVSAWINLCLATGRAGRPLSGYGCLTGQGNGQGGREHGQKADQLPGYRKLDDPAARAHVARVWGVEPETLPGPGRSAYELLDALGGDVRSLLLMGSNPVVSAPHAGHVEERLRSLDFLAVADVVLSETAALADVVLPVTQWAEETGTTTNLEGRVLLRLRAVSPPPGVRSDLEVLGGLASLLGHEKGFPSDPEEVFDELRRASAGGPADYSGITYGRIAAENGVFWPCPETTAEPDGPGSAEPTALGHEGPRSPNRRRRAPDRHPRPCRASPPGPTAPQGARPTPERPGSFSSGLPHPTGAPGSSRSRIEPPPRRPTRLIPCCSPPVGSSRSISPGHRPGVSTSSMPPRPGRSSSCIRCSPSGSGPSRVNPSPWCRGAAGPSGRRGSLPGYGRTPCSCRSTGLARAGSTR